MNDVCYTAELEVNGKVVKSGMFCFEGEEVSTAMNKLEALVTEAAKKENGIGRIWWRDSLVFECKGGVAHDINNS